MDGETWEGEGRGREAGVPLACCGPGACSQPSWGQGCGPIARGSKLRTGEQYLAHITPTQAGSEVQVSGGL